MAYEFVLTLLAAVVAVWIKRDALTSTLLGAWVVSLILAGFIPQAWLPAAATIVDVIIAITAIKLWTDHDSQRARIVGVLSLAKVLCHVAISSQLGTGIWFNYAFLVNCLFVLQCLAAGGLIYGLVDFLNNISPRHRSGGLASHPKERK